MLVCDVLLNVFIIFLNFDKFYITIQCKHPHILV
jgi:hypothetical protein